MTETTNKAFKYSNVRIITRGAYDIQHLRIEIGNRIWANFRSKFGLESSQKESELETVKLDVLKELRKSYRLITKGVTDAKISPKHFTGDSIISTLTEFILLSHYFDIEKQEEKHFRDLEKVLRDFPIYTEFLKDVKGIGPAMAGVIISEIDIHRAKYPSSLWKLAGLDCAPDGRGRSRRAEHLIDVEYTDKDGNKKLKKSITFNPFLKTKLIGVLGTSFLRSKSPYAQIYYNYKTRYENHPNWIEKTPKHRHNAAIRKMVKIFLIDLHMKWRELEGLEVSLPYHEAKLGIKHTEGSSLAIETNETKPIERDIMTKETDAKKRDNSVEESKATERAQKREEPREGERVIRSKETSIIDRDKIAKKTTKTKRAMIPLETKTINRDSELNGVTKPAS